MSDAAAIGWIREVVLDCAEPWVLARFWAGLLGGTPVQWYPGWVTLEPPSRPAQNRASTQGSAQSSTTSLIQPMTAASLT